MEGSRFDSLARDLASSRRTLVRGTAGGGFLALLGAAFGKKSIASAQSGIVTCTWEIEAQGSVGPNASRSYDGILTVDIDEDGSIDNGSYVFTDESGNPKRDSQGNEIRFDAVGSCHKRSINIRIEHDGCEEITFTGVNRYHLVECKGPMSGSCHGPDLIDHGGWRTRRKNICPACRAQSCPPHQYLDSKKCRCVDKCPPGYSICKEQTCVPDQCGSGKYYDEDRCDCTCVEKKTCGANEVWCPYACRCIPTDPCDGFECPPGYVHTMSHDGICSCRPRTCTTTCKTGERQVSCGGKCKCVPNGGCKKTTCPNGKKWDTKTCGCICSNKPSNCSNWDSSKCKCNDTTCTSPPNCSDWDSSKCMCNDCDNYDPDCNDWDGDNCYCNDCDNYDPNCNDWDGDNCYCNDCDNYDPNCNDWDGDNCYCNDCPPCGGYRPVGTCDCECDFIEPDCYDWDSDYCVCRDTTCNPPPHCTAIVDPCECRECDNYDQYCSDWNMGTCSCNDTTCPPVSHCRAFDSNCECTDCDNYDSSCSDWNWQTCECNDSCCGDCGSGKYCANCECVCENADDQYYCNNWDSENCWCNDTACPPCYGYQEPGTCSCDCSAYYCDEGYTMGDDCGCY